MVPAEKGAKEAALLGPAGPAHANVVRLLDPVFVVGKQVATSRFEIPSEREVERVAPALEEVMAQAATELLGDE